VNGRNTWDEMRVVPVDHGRCSRTGDHHIQDDLFVARDNADVATFFGILVDDRFRCSCCIVIEPHKLSLYDFCDFVVTNLSSGCNGSSMSRCGCKFVT